MKLKAIGGIGALMLLTIISCQSNDAMEFNRYYLEGSAVYQSHCQNCHGERGQGLNGLIPPLTDSIFIKNNRHQLPCIVQNGLKGKLTIGKKDFEGQMPPAGLANIEIAQALTYITNTFGNKAGIFNVEMVNGDLEKCR